MREDQRCGTVDDKLMIHLETLKISHLVNGSRFSNIASSKHGNFVFASPPSRKKERDMGGAQALKRIPRIKFPQRHPKSSGSQEASTTANADVTFISRIKASSMTVGGKASLQPKRTPLSSEEIEAILLGGCI